MSLGLAIWTIWHMEFSNSVLDFNTNGIACCVLEYLYLNEGEGGAMDILHGIAFLFLKYSYSMIHFRMTSKSPIITSIES